ncbi:hypothetical protein [uncultured Roseibium sp.]|uniref:hypothetical protein n=1 Tax=uncultured Roseibium sp. TaxID=1936171 RepID=UPI00262FB7D4|nr:hypothetical protein [uncultured Roseibium sp.]
MAKSEDLPLRKSVSGRNDLRDAKPLLQAIFLGMALAIALVAAAAMASSDAEDNPGAQGPAIDRQVTGDGRGQNSGRGV